jgi:hypothetical protein
MTRPSERFRNAREPLRGLHGGFFLRKKPLERVPSVYANSENALTRRFAGPAIVLAAAALAAAPLLLRGPSCGADFEFHLVSWLDAQRSWLQGIPYPHWTPSANYGAGEPRFVFYPPLTWMMGAALGLILPWTLVPAVLTFLLLAATGLATRALARQFLDDAPATLAGCATLFSGFAYFTAYERAAFAELAGGFWIPLLLLFALSSNRQDAGSANPPLREPSSLWRRALNGSAAPLALVLAGCWLSNAPVGVMASYLLAAVALIAALVARSWAPILRAAVAAPLGLALPAAYLVPAAWEQRWVDIREAVDYPLFQIENNWLFARYADPVLERFNAVSFRASMLAVVTVGIAMASFAVLWRRGRLSAKRDAVAIPPGWWTPLAVIPIAVLVLQFPVSLPLWNLLPKLRFLQFPWRWLLVVEAPLAVFLAAAVWPGKSARPWLRWTVAGLCALSFVLASVFLTETFFRPSKDGDSIQSILSKYRSGKGFDGTDEYEPQGAEHWIVASGLPDACFSADANIKLGVADPPDSTPIWRPEEGSCETTAVAQLRQAERLRIVTVAAHPGYLILRLYSYPAWRVEVNGRPVAALPQRDDGLMAVPVPQGPVNLAVAWATTADAIAGRCIGAAALLLLIALFLLERKLSRPRLS